MNLFASFNGGPSDFEFKLAILVAGLAAIAIGYVSRRIVLGAIGGGLAGAFIYGLLLSARGGFMGAEFLFPFFGLGGVIIGGVAGAVGRLSRGVDRGKPRRQHSDGDLDA